MELIQESDYGWPITLVSFICFLFLNFGNLLLYGVIHYENYGQDPKKRSFPDRMFATCCWWQIYVSFTNGLIFQYRYLTGKLNLKKAQPCLI